MSCESEFKKLLEITDTLLGPEGCPWDREQTLMSIRQSVVEEACELKEAIEFEDDAHVCEELGDLFFNAVFLSRLAEKEKRFTMVDALDGICEKLIRRHPHVFGDVKIENVDDVRKQWEKIKKSEKGKEKRESFLDSLPAGLPVINRAHMLFKKVIKTVYTLPFESTDIEDEDDLANKILSLVYEAARYGYDLEHILRKKMTKIEKDFREFESSTRPNDS